MTAKLRVNRSIPASTVIPVLLYPDVRVAAQWLCEAFGFTERLRIHGHRIQLHVGDGAVVAAEGEASAAGHSIMVRVADARAHHERARQAGAKILRAPEDHPYGECQYTAADLAGHVWTFSESIADVDPASWGGELVES